MHKRISIGSKNGKKVNEWSNVRLIMCEKERTKTGSSTAAQKVYLWECKEIIPLTAEEVKEVC